jgi:catechol-2,3-dioxygenase
MPGSSNRPTRLHHHAYVSSNLEATRQFYEDIVGLPLVTTWCEGEGLSAYCHAFFELADASCLAFFQFADESAASQNLAARATSRYYHIALNATAETQENAAQRAEAKGVEARFIDHGYCRSLYLTDPDGMVVELTVDNPEAEPLISQRRENPHAELVRWLGGDHTPNNMFRDG